MKTLTREEQHAQCMREVKWTLLVVAVCAAWHIGTAFALNGSGLYFLGMPAWFTVSVLGTCVLGIAGVVLLARFVFVDFAYDEEVDDAGDAGGGSAAAGNPGVAGDGAGKAGVNKSAAPARAGDQA